MAVRRDTAPGGGPGDARNSASPFVGRDRELIRLRRAAQEARDGTPSVIVVHGISGIGKTSLVRTLFRGLPDFTVLAARANQHESHRSYTTLGNLYYRAGMADQAVAAAAAHISPLTAGAEFLQALDKLQRTHPIGLVLDNADWADADSLRAIGFALSRLWQDRVLAIVVVQAWPPLWEESVLQTFESMEHLVHVEIPGLSEKEIQQLATAAWGERLNADRLQSLLRRSGGHPLYIRTLLSDLTANWQRTEREEDPVPAGLTAAVLRQVAALPPDSGKVLAALAVIDGAAPVTLLADIADVRDAAGALEAPDRAGFIAWSPVYSVTQASFRHSVQRDAVYDALSPADRRRLHLRAAAVLSPREALRHRVAATVGAEPQLCEDLKAASLADVAEGHLASAGAHLAWAARVAGDAGERQQLLCGAVRLSFWAGRDGEAARLSTQIAQDEPSALEREALGLLSFADGQLSRARHHLTRSLDELATAGQQGDIVVAVATEQAAACALMGEGAEAEHAANTAIRANQARPERVVAPALGVPFGLPASARAFRAYGLALQKGAPRGLQELEYVPASPDEVGEEDFPALVFRGLLRSVLGQFAGAEADLTTTSTRVGPYGVRVLGLGSRVHLALCHFMSGTWEQARRDAEIGLTMVEARGRSFDRASLLSLLATIDAAQGEVERAEQEVAQASREAAQLDYLGAHFHIALAHAVIARARHDHPGVLRALGSVSTGATSTQRTRLFAPWWAPLQVESLIECRQLSEAQRVLNFLELDADAAGNGLFSVLTAWLEGRLIEERGRPRDAALRYAQGVASPLSEDAPLFRALLEQAFGKCLHHLGKAEQGLTHLRQAEHLFSRLGALPFLEECRSAISATSGSSGYDVPELAMLSPREREVARLVGLGRTNREIAASLFLSMKTVEYHLRNIFNKMDIANRRELRDWVQQGL
ncbi:AAA family ATPase [Streptomyces sp. NPDC058249]|uniref:helix-turn-helix transcriptional regulator n=1 Tax=Streptomyces sp. NPDC058249 TaxID=3346403 RepID=UPI0036E0E70D